MTKKEALSLLNSTNEEEALENYEWLVFEQKNKLLMKLPPIKIIKAIKERINKYGNALKSLNIIVENDFNVHLPTLDNQTSSRLIEYLNQYQKSISNIRLNIANLTNSEMLIEQLDYLIDNQIQLFKYLDSFIDLPSVNRPIDDIKLSEEINIFKLQQEIIKNEPDTTNLIDYISSHNECYLFKCIIIAKKQIDYNGLR